MPWSETCPMEERTKFVLEALAVLALDADGGVDAEPAGALPREHVLGDLLVQEAVAAEVAKDAVLDRGLQRFPVVWL